MKPFWDVEENEGFILIKSDIDSLEYKVYNTGTPEEKQAVANSLANVRRDLNKLLFYLCRHPEEWINKKIALGIFLTLDLHIPCINNSIDKILNATNDNKLSNEINMECLRIGKLFNIQEMTPNEYGILGLNKPKATKNITINDSIEYEIATRRSFHLTIRSSKGVVDDYLTKTLPLAVHEITHTTCNDNHWKEDNHQYPFHNYHSFFKKIIENNIK